MAERDYSGMSREQLVNELLHVRATLENDAQLRVALQRAQAQAVELHANEASLAGALQDLELERQRWTELFDLAPSHTSSPISMGSFKA